MNTKEFRSAVSRSTKARKELKDPCVVVDELVTKTEEAVSKARDIGFRGDDVRALRGRLVLEAEGRWMATRYAVVDLSFAEGVRYVRVGRDPNSASPIMLGPAVEGQNPGRGELVAKLPVFVEKWDSPDHFQERYNDEDRHRQRDQHFECGRLPGYSVAGMRFPASNVTASVRVPDGITPQMFNAARRCKAYLEMFDVMLLDRGVDTADYRDGSASMGVLWAPTDESWSFRDRVPAMKGDPAVLIRRGVGPAYLVGYYDTPDEKPIDNLVREFSRGKTR